MFRGLHTIAQGRFSDISTRACPCDLGLSAVSRPARAVRLQGEIGGPGLVAVHFLFTAELQLSKHDEAGFFRSSSQALETVTADIRCRCGDPCSRWGAVRHRLGADDTAARVSARDAE